MYENNGYVYNMPKTFFRVEVSFSRGRSPPLSYGPGHQINLGMQKSHCRPMLDWYMGMYSQRLLVRFLLNILKSSLVGLEHFSWEFD